MLSTKRSHTLKQTFSRKALKNKGIDDKINIKVEITCFLVIQCTLSHEGLNPSNQWFDHKHLFKCKLYFWKESWLIRRENFSCGAIQSPNVSDLVRHFLQYKWCLDVVVITTLQLHSTKFHFSFCPGSNSARAMSEVCDADTKSSLSSLSS